MSRQNEVHGLSSKNKMAYNTKPKTKHYCWYTKSPRNIGTCTYHGQSHSYLPIQGQFNALLNYATCLAESGELWHSTPNKANLLHWFDLEMPYDSLLDIPKLVLVPLPR